MPPEVGGASAMDERNSGKRVVNDEIAKGESVGRAVRRVVDDSLSDLDDAITKSERDLKEAKELYDEVEGEPPAEAD
jgi:hypothetical protein